MSLTVNGSFPPFLTITVLLMAKGGAALFAKGSIGTFHRIVATTTPYDCGNVKVRWLGVFRLDVRWASCPAST